jgi:aminopeptidase N
MHVFPAVSKRHAGGTVGSRDFQRDMQDAAKKDLSKLFEAWVC